MDPTHPPPAALPLAAFACPHCQRQLSVLASPVEQVLICPHCHQSFSLPAFAMPAASGIDLSAVAQPAQPQHAPGEFYVVDDEPTDLASKSARQAADELDGMRIHQIAHLRRAAARSFTYCLIVAVVCIVAVVQLVFNVVAQVRQHHAMTTKAIGYVLCVAVLLLVGGHFCSRARSFYEESRRSDLHEPDRPPDFTGLSDGSQRWDDLKQVK